MVINRSKQSQVCRDRIVLRNYLSFDSVKPIFRFYVAIFWNCFKSSLILKLYMMAKTAAFATGLQCNYHSVPEFCPRGGTSILGGREGDLAPNFASKNIGDKYPKFCPLNLRFDPKIRIFSQLLCLVVTEFPKFFLLFGELGRTLPQILPPNLM